MIHWVAAVLTLGGLLMMGGGIGLVRHESEVISSIKTSGAGNYTTHRLLHRRRSVKAPKNIEMKLPVGDLNDYYTLDHDSDVEMKFLGKIRFQDQDCSGLEMHIPRIGDVATMSLSCASNQFYINIHFNVISESDKDAENELAHLYSVFLHKTDISKWQRDEEEFINREVIDISQDLIDAVVNNEKLSVNWLLQIEDYMQEKIETTKVSDFMDNYMDSHIHLLNWRRQRKNLNEYEAELGNENGIVKVAFGKRYAVVDVTPTRFVSDLACHIVPYTLKISGDVSFSSGLSSPQSLQYIYPIPQKDKFKMVGTPWGTQCIVMDPLPITTADLKALGVELP